MKEFLNVIPPGLFVILFSLVTGGSIVGYNIPNDTIKEPIRAVLVAKPVPLAVSIAKLEEWKFNLGDCESNNIPSAINPNDLDGTPSYGQYQFKIGTFKYYVEKYNLFDWQNWEEDDWWEAIFDGEKQHIVLEHMIEDPEVNFTWEFPWCVEKLGLPPVI